MNILFLAPIPPPINGHSLASLVLLKHLTTAHDVRVVDLNKKTQSGKFKTVKRAIEVIRILWSIKVAQKNTDRIYFTISESVSGNLKDLLAYLLCFGNLGKMVVHLHGGSLKKLLFDRHRMLFVANRFFLSRVKGAIILGDSHKNIFSDILPTGKIHVVPNFAEDFVFSTEAEIRGKFVTPGTINLLFLTNLLPKKGYSELLNAFVQLEDEMKKSFRLDFAGRFDSEKEKEGFLALVGQQKNVFYHGVVHAQEKKNLLQNAHALCLPTSYLEGQPISILEAYAAGCVVLSTNSGGISDIFSDGTNGILIKDRSKEAVKIAIEHLFKHREGMLSIGLQNFRSASEKYRTSTYCGRVANIIEQKP